MTGVELHSGTTAPPEIISFIASPTLISRYVSDSFGAIIKNPLVGFGVVGTKTFTTTSPVRA